MRCRPGTCALLMSSAALHPGKIVCESGFLVTAMFFTEHAKALWVFFVTRAALAILPGAVVLESRPCQCQILDGAN